jgi:hypothetical protein
LRHRMTRSSVDAHVCGGTSLSWRVGMSGRQQDAFPFQEALRPLFSRVGCNMTLFQLTLNQAKVDLTLNRRIGTEEAIVISQRK